VKRLGIVAKTDREEARTVVPQLLDWCAARGIQPILEKETAGLCPQATGPVVGRSELPAQSDLLLVPRRRRHAPQHGAPGGRPGGGRSSASTWAGSAS